MSLVDRPIALLSLAAGLALAAPPAPAVDLTGTWSGMQVCHYFEAGNPKTYTFRNDVLRLTQSGNDAFFTSALVGGATYSVQLFEDAQRPADKAQGIFVECGTTPESTYQELGRLHKLQIVDGGYAIFEGTSSFFQVDPDRRFMGTCDWYYRRVDTEDPGLTECATGEESAPDAKTATPKGRRRP